MSTIDCGALRTKLEQEKGKQASLTLELVEINDALVVLRKGLIRHEKALEVVKKVGLATQQQLQFHISEITSLAMLAIFPQPYKVEVDFIERRNKIECDLFFSRNDERINPKKEAGGGAVDIAAFALRVACFTMMNPRPRPVIVLDEPFRFLSKDMQDRAALLLKELSEKLGLQFIIVTHEKQLTETANKAIEISKSKKISKANEISLLR